MVDITAKIGKMEMSSPIILASGTCGFGRELSEYVDFKKVGGLSSKGLTYMPRAGNLGCRSAETPSGMLNSVGLQNPGVHAFIADELDAMNALGCKVIVNIGGHSNEDYIRAVELIHNQAERVDAIELNFSCPNVKAGCMQLGTDPDAVFQLMSDLRARTHLPLWVKLTPNITQIQDAAVAAEKGGADAIVAINTLLGMAVNVASRRPVLYNNTGGLSGPAIKPVALRMVHACAQAVSIPVIGCGGICSAQDILEFMIAGASAVQIGTVTLIHPAACEKMTEELMVLMHQHGIDSLSGIVGTLQLWGEE